MKTEIVKLSQVAVNSANPRQITDGNFAKLVTSILVLPKMLEIRPIVVDDTMTALGGNMRYKALTCISQMSEQEMRQRLNVSRDFQKKTEAEQEMLISHWLEFQASPKVAIIKASDLSDEEKREFIIKDNVGYGDWNMDMLANEWDTQELVDWGVDIDWDAPEENETSDDDCDPDALKPEEPTSKFGDVYQLGEHRLVVGDSTKDEFIAALMNGELADCVITDPPYNVDYEGSDGKKIANDKMEDTPFQDFLTAAFTAINNHLKCGGVFYIWHADSEGYNFRTACKRVGWQVRQCLIWNKNSLVLGRQDYQWKHEPCLYGWKDGAGHYFVNKRDLTTVIDENKPKKNGDHPTMKPVPLIGKQVENSTRKGEIVLDAFGGSGTTLIACEQLGRKCRMVEYDPVYADVIIRRWEEQTGGKAVLLGNCVDETKTDE